VQARGLGGSFAARQDVDDRLYACLALGELPRVLAVAPVKADGVAWARSLVEPLPQCVLSATQANPVEHATSFAQLDRTGVLIGAVGDIKPPRVHGDAPEAEKASRPFDVLPIRVEPCEHALDLVQEPIKPRGEIKALRRLLGPQVRRQPLDVDPKSRVALQDDDRQRGLDLGAKRRLRPSGRGADERRLTQDEELDSGAIPQHGSRPA
jgi:hypothetical protein